MTFKNAKSSTIIIILFSFQILCVAKNASGQQTTGNAAAIVRGAVNIEKISDVNFGSISPSQSLSGSVQINSNGTVSSTNVTYLGDGSVGEYNISGPSDGSYTPAISQLNTLSDGINSMNVALQIDGGTANRQISDGTDILKVIGTLIIQANQPPNIYSGTYNITASY